MSNDDNRFMRNLLLTPCISKEALGDWFKVFLGVELFSNIVSRHATSSPLDAAWELYDFALRPKGQKPELFLYASSRATQKTLLLAAVETALILHSQRNIIHYAAFRSQVKPAHQYMVNFASRPYIKDLLKDDPTQSNIVYLVPIDPQNEKYLSGISINELYREDPLSIRLTSLELLGISAANTQGRHESIISIDEVSSLSGADIGYYNDIAKIPIASWKGDPYLLFKISTRRGAYSVVEKEISNAEKTGLNVRRWTVFEGIERCSDERSGTDFVHERYVDVTTGSFLTKPEYDLLEPKRQKDHEMIKYASGCLNCPLRVHCGTDAKKQKSESIYLQKIDAAIVDRLSTDLDFYNSQCMSLMPAKEGLVFTKYDPSVHFIEADEMYKTFTGEHPPQPQTRDSLVRLFRSRGLACYIGLDWGFTDPTAITVLFTDGTRAFIVETFSKPGLEPERHIVPILREMQQRYGSFKIFPDTARPDNNSILARNGFSVYDKFEKKIGQGVDLIRAALMPAVGTPNLFLLRGHADELNDELKLYHYVIGPDGTPTDDIADENNHSIDTVRYIYLNIFGKTRTIMAASEVTPDNPLQGVISQAVLGGAGVTVSSNKDGKFWFSIEHSDDTPED